MSGFQICIPKEYLSIYHQCYINQPAEDVLGMKERIEHELQSESIDDDNQEPGTSLQQAEHTSHSTTEGNIVQEQTNEDEEDNDLDGAIMDRADVLFKYILRSFRKHYCKSF